MIYVYSEPDQFTSPKFAHNFAHGCDGQIITDGKLREGAWAGFGSPTMWTLIRQQQARGGDWYYGDKAYFGRDIYYRITKNAMQHSGIGEPDLIRLHRAALGVKPQKWKQGSDVIITTHSDFFYTLYGTTKNRWLEEVITKVKQTTERKIILRQNKRDPIPFEYLLQNAWCVVTMTSKTAIDALMHGVPAICTHDCAASPMTRNDPRDVENLLYPDNRLEWAGVLAANQWTFDEIKNGVAWEAIR